MFYVHFFLHPRSAQDSCARNHCAKRKLQNSSLWLLHFHQSPSTPRRQPRQELLSTVACTVVCSKHMHTNVPEKWHLHIKATKMASFVHFFFFSFSFTSLNKRGVVVGKKIIKKLAFFTHTFCSTLALHTLAFTTSGTVSNSLKFEYFFS